MRTNLTEPRTFFIIGMPRGGTTIVAKVFNSLEDGFCLGEPHWFWRSQGMDLDKTAEHCFGKVELELDSIDNLLSVIRKSDYTCKGYKETWLFAHQELKRIIEQHKDEADFFLVVFRNPVMVHSSQFSLGWKDRETPADFLQAYRELDILARHKNAIPIVYEDFITGQLDYLNSKLPFKICGHLWLMPSGHTYGDPFANNSQVIREDTRKISIQYDWIKQHDEALQIWASWSN